MALIGCARGIFSYRIAFPFCYGYSRYMNADGKRKIIDQFSGRTRTYNSGGVYNAVTSRQLGMVADAVTAVEWDEWVENVRAGESAMRDLRLRIEALRDNNGVLPECETCGGEFTGRSDARYCSTRCRVAAHRAKGKRG